ncbi:hypothetical protein BER93_06155 [Xanthomonas fragariae]|nr:hypothetical protein BER92_06145 [Xanthomonas fragariae]AOD17773.1 hypothetical protein BER93_06155 [Xanthomonas fragariae]ENZ94644.1 nucleotide excision repair endonuclease [Xanthomonas fragariae LMG 25863]
MHSALEILPATPGVYLFQGDGRELPLYIGKSVNLRVRVMDHFRTLREESLLRQTRRVSVIQI